MSITVSKSINYPHQTPGWSSIHSNQVYQNRLPSEQKQHKKLQYRNSIKSKQMSILQKIQAAKFTNIEDIDISHKMNKGKNKNNQTDRKYYNQQNIKQISTIGQNSEVKPNQKENHLITFSPITLKNKIQSHINQKSSNKNRNSVLQTTPNRNKFDQPTQSWLNKITPQKSRNYNQTSFIKGSSIPSHSQNGSISQISRYRKPLSQISIHQQLYLQSKKKQIKKSAQQIVQNQYFKKKHPFAPQIGEISHFLAEQRISRLKQRQNFQMEFEQFDQQEQQGEQSIISKAKIQRQNKKDYFDNKNRRQMEQKQAQLKNYTMLKSFFHFLSDDQQTLRYFHLDSRKLVNLPSPCLKFLQPILQGFYLNKKKKSLNWLQFLSQFNLKVSNKKSFYKLIEKWFLLEYRISFQGPNICENKLSKLDQCVQRQTKQNSRVFYRQQSTCGGTKSEINNQSKSNVKSKRVSAKYIT